MALKEIHDRQNHMCTSQQIWICICKYSNNIFSSRLKRNKRLWLKCLLMLLYLCFVSVLHVFHESIILLSGICVRAFYCLKQTCSFGKLWMQQIHISCLGTIYQNLSWSMKCKLSFCKYAMYLYLLKELFLHLCITRLMKM